MRSSAQPTLLLMTATIVPPEGVLALHRTDPALRLQDYLNALAFYLSPKCRMIDRIVFVENSASDLAPLRELAERQSGGKQVEFVSFYGLDYSPSYTRGYGEFKLLDHAFRHSQLLGQLGQEDAWWKVTGRIKVLNFDRMVQTAPPSYDLYADFRWWKREADVRLLSFSRGGYARLFLNFYHELAGVRIEDFFFERFAPLMERKDPSVEGIVPEFRTVPRFEGIGGWGNLDYSSPKSRMIYLARSVYRLFRNVVAHPSDRAS